jgi:hypothetical protein
VTASSSESLALTVLHIPDNSILQGTEIDINVEITNLSLKFADNVKGNKHSGFTKKETENIMILRSEIQKSNYNRLCRTGWFSQVLEDTKKREDSS